MKLRVPDTFVGEVRDVDLLVYNIVDGVVDIPDDKVHDGLWGMGFTQDTSAKAYTSRPVSVAPDKEQ